MMRSLLAARRARPKETDVGPATASSAPTSAWVPPALALAALLSLSCQRNLTHEPAFSRGGNGAGGSTATPSGGQRGNSGGTTGGNAGNGGSTSDAGADQRLPSQDAGIDRAPDTTTTTGGCPVDCNHLPNVQPNVVAKCVQGKCILPPNSCLAGFGSCGGTNTGCETDLTTASNCGICYFKCAPPQSCQHLSSGAFTCLGPCPSPRGQCGYLCLDLQTDISNCGACGNDCSLPNTDVACVAGKCVSLGCNDPGWADCTSDPGCETPIGQLADCGGCGDPACTLTNTLFTCADGGKCDAAVCAPGFANCNTTSADCETSFDSPPASGSCLPHYVGTLGIATESFDNAWTAIAPDGSFFLAGDFTGAVDFDPSSGRDVHTAADKDGYITKFNSDGSYGWTAVFAGRGDILLNGLVLTPSGNVVTAGFYFDTVDLDPGPGTDVRVAATVDLPEAFAVELTATGALVWATLPGVSYGTGVAVDSTGAVYVAGGGSVASLTKLTASGKVDWTQSFTNGACSSSLNAVAVAKDGTVWATGAADAGDGCTITPQAGQSVQSDVLIVRVAAGGDTISVRTLGNQMNGNGFALAASPDGSMYLGGVGSGETVFDPGPPSVKRWLGGNGGAGFLLKLDATGALIWVRSVNGPYLNAMAATPDGGLLAAGLSDDFGMFVTRLTPTGASIWSFEVGSGQASALSISSAGTGFVVGGTSNGGTVDFDPGPGVDPVFGEISFLSRFTF